MVFTLGENWAPGGGTEAGAWGGAGREGPDSTFKSWLRTWVPLGN